MDSSQWIVQPRGLRTAARRRARPDGIGGYRTLPRRTQDWLEPKPTVGRHSAEVLDSTGGLDAVHLAIGRSRSILELQDNWDGEGSRGYTKETWNRVREFLMSVAREYVETEDMSAPAPTIGPAQDGSIDLLWNVGDRTFLINIPSENSEPASFYGEGAGRNSIKGLLETDTPNQWLMAWLTA